MTRQYFWDEEKNLYRLENTVSIEYSDGDEVEQRLLDVMRGAKDRSTFSCELIQHIKDWPSEYHLSRQRHCLVRPLGIKPGDRVLELGCGCGAITRYLGEIGAEVTAVEGSLMRAMIAAERCRDLKNVKIFVDNIVDFATEDRFDWVLLVGVLEYAPVFSNSDKPVKHYLEVAARYLNNNGRLVIAIENKLGLKYFNACAEDHIGVPFYGLQGLYGTKTPRTFGRHELINLLEEVGASRYCFYYPFPDYKLPSVVVSEKGLNDQLFDPVDLLARAHARDYSGLPYRAFDEALVFSSLGDNKLIADLANSFLIVASFDAAEPCTSDALAMTFAVNRVPEFAAITSFYRKDEGIAVVKEPVFPDLVRRKELSSDLAISNHPGELPYFRGRQLFWKLLASRARGETLEAYVVNLRPWLDYLLRFAYLEGDGTDCSMLSPDERRELKRWLIPGSFLDCIPFNLIETEQGLVFIDDEWQANRPVELGWVITRGILWSLCVGVTVGTAFSVSEVTQQLCRTAGLTVSEEDILKWGNKEEEFQSLVNGCCVDVMTLFNRSELGMAQIQSELNRRNKQIEALNKAVADKDVQINELNKDLREKNEQIAALNQALVERDSQIANLNQAVAERDKQIVDITQKLNDKSEQLTKLNQKLVAEDIRITNLNQAIAERDEQIAVLNQKVAERDKEIAMLANNIGMIYRSRSWRITAPLRFITTKIRRFVQPKPRWGIGSQLIAGVLTLPVTFYFYKGLREWLKALVSGKEFFSKVLDCPSGVFNRLRQSPRPVRLSVMIPLLMAWVIRNNAGVIPASYEIYKVLRRDGIGSFRWWLSRLYSEMVTRVNVSNIAATDGVPDPKRILVMDYRIPRADISAGELATEGILRDLCDFGFDVVFLPNDMLPSRKYEDRLKSFGLNVVTNESGYQSPGQYIAENGSSFAIFYLIRVDVAESVLDVIRKASPLAKIIFHAPDVYFLREKREAELHGSKELMLKAEQMKMRELSVMERADHVVVVSEIEKALLEQYISAEKISVFNVLYAPVVDNPPALDGRKHIFFLGGYAHRPNVDAVHWFVSEIWPLVRKELPDTEFHILGAEAPDPVRELDKLPGVRFIGFVENLDEVLQNYRLGVAPLRYGAGIKGKVAMTMGAGIPCVCTSVAAEGMGIQDGIHALLADEPEAFAAAVIRLMTDNELWESISSSGRRFVRQRFSEEANRLSFLGVLNEARVLPLQLYIDYCRGIAPEPVPAVPPGKQVDVSIIIPVYNQWAMTAACINSVIMDIKRCHDISCEIILADDGSSDETVRAFEIYPGLRVVKTSKNVGFLRNCNNAAKHARGRYLLLLNNDTIVLPGWLSGLFNTIENDPTIVVVGSKLLYPDGTIQEAGGLLFSDATGFSVGRSFPRYTPIFNIERETDYISGASILVRKSFWDKVGGFDERYENAYCEDSDLAMRARAEGMRVVYQPVSEVVHFERRTYTEQNWSLQRRNTRLLLEKWRDSLQSEHFPSTTPWYKAASNAERRVPHRVQERRKEGKLNVLYFSPFPSHPVNHGNRATINHFARLLKKRGFKVYFVLLQSDQYTGNDLEDMRKAWDSLDIIPYTNSNPLSPDRNMVLFDGWYEEGIGEHIRCLCAKYDIDIVWCSYVFHSKLLEYVPDYILKVIDTHDKMGNRFEMLRERGIPLEFFSCTPEDEGAYLRRADIVIARREEEAQYFNEVSGLNTAIVIAHIEEPHFVNKEFKYLKNVGVVASPNQINLMMVDNFVKAIGKQLQGRDCSFEVHVAGQVKDMIMSLPASERTSYDVPWLHLHGFIDDIGSFYKEMDIICSPVTIGTGINVKTVQAMAYGMPLLATSCSIKGIETCEPLHEHPDIDDLVKSLFHLVDHPEELQRLAAVSRERFERFYEDNMNNFRLIFNHPKLHVQSDNSDRIAHSDEE